MSPFAPIAPPARVLMGPGPSDVAPSVLRAMGAATIGHLDPAFLQVMDEVRTMLRQVMGTDNDLTMPMSGTGSAGLETCVVNLVEPGDRVVVGVNGVFGGRLAEVCRRAGAEVTTVDVPWGRPLDPDAMRRQTRGGCDVICLVHAETSTGALTDLSPWRSIADEAGGLLLVDAVTSLGGVPVDVDAHGLDAVYSGTQKCLSCPPGLSPVTLSKRAQERIARRRQPCQSWYLDLGLIARYWGAERAYHHTAPINAIFGLHEALRLVLEEGLEARYGRHRRCSAALAAGLTAMGLALPVAEEARLPPLTLVTVPEGVDEARVRRELLERYGLEIGGGLGDFAGQAWRIGLMGSGCTARNVSLCLAALGDALRGQGFEPRTDPLAAAQTVLRADRDA